MSILAYVDPGLGLLAWQACAAFFIGLLFYVRKTRSWLMQCLRKVVHSQKRVGVSPVQADRPRDPLLR